MGGGGGRKEVRNKIFKIVFGIPFLIWGIFYIMVLGILLIAFSLDILEEKRLFRYSKGVKNKWTKKYIGK